MTRKPLRLWPGVVAATLQWFAWLVLPAVFPPWAMYGFLGGIALGPVILLWWLFFSRAPWSERLGAIVVMVVAVIATSFFVHPSISNGMMGTMLYFYSVPLLGLALVAWAVASRSVSGGLRHASMVAAIAIACGTLMLIRTDGMSGEGYSDIHWRWTPTAEERLLALTRDDVPPPPPAAIASVPETVPAPTPGTSPPAVDKDKGVAADPTAAKTDTESLATSEGGSRRVEWPGFRGPHRDNVVRGVRIDTDWSRKPPIELWRKPIGPGWSSFAVHGERIFTQEQRGEDEVVSAYDLKTGEPVWRHRDRVRFWESNGGAGPRATPTLHNGRVYTMGATGVVNALDEGTGAVIWSRNAATDTGKEIPDWGLASSPVVIDDLVIVAASGHLVAYDIRTGNPRWFGEKGGGGYSSPHLVTIDGVPQILLIRGSRTISVAPADGTLLWDHNWAPAVAIVQPALVGNGDVLIGLGDVMGGLGMRRIAVTRGAGGWTVEERWTSRGLKPYFNDFVVHEGHAYGFDGSILASVDLAGGERKWKGGRYGHGQMILLPDQDLLLVLSEDGEVALVSATPDKFTEIAKVPAIEGKTWNHPVLVGDVLLVRNGEEMAALRMPIACQ